MSRGVKITLGVLAVAALLVITFGSVALAAGPNSTCDYSQAQLRVRDCSNQADCQQDQQGLRTCDCQAACEQAQDQLRQRLQDCPLTDDAPLQQRNAQGN